MSITGEWGKKMWTMHTMEYCLSLKRNETDTCFNHENIRRGERASHRRPTEHDSIHV